ncbi:tetratricopeptide repeat protein [Salinicola socius]|uniref:tetratricopeptide repeat protein n=1 Tax=Salinicola socius TaxID=404433 RepID=UPI0009FEDEC5|nr:hypothetical protein [Salinicola socius]
MNSKKGCRPGKRYLPLVTAILFSLGGVPPVEAEGPALRADMIQTLQSMQSQLKAGEDATVASRAAASAARLEGGNAADRWARALFLQLAASANAHQGNDAEAADQFAEARRIDDVPDTRRLSWLYQEARLRLSAGQTRQGADLLTRWVERSGGDDASRWLLVQVRASLKEWSAAADSLDRISESDTGGWSPSQRQLASTVYQQTGRFDDALALLGDGGNSPDAWRRAAGLARQAGDDGRAAAIWESGWRRGVLTSNDDLLQLARLHIAGGTPARAGEHLTRWLDSGQLDSSTANLRLLAEAWTAARHHDQALAAWQTLAERSDRAQDWQQLAELSYGWGEWQTTLDALAGLRRSGGEISGRDWLLQGIAATQLDRPDVARKAFRQAKAAGVEQAQQWLDSLG